MADENTPKDQRTSIASIIATLDEIDPRVHRRLLGFINEARTPEDLLVAPANRAVVNEEEEHLDFVEQEPEETPMMALEAAQALIRARDRVSPNQGFAHLKQAVGSRDWATLVRGKDSYHHFEAAHVPRRDLEPEALEFHKMVSEEQVKVLYRGTGKTAYRA